MQRAKCKSFIVMSFINKKNVILHFKKSEFYVKKIG